MYNKIECVMIECDNCHESYLDADTGFSIFVDENNAHDAIDNDGWHTEHGNVMKGIQDKHYCPECYSFNDDDNLILKEVNNDAE